MDAHELEAALLQLVSEPNYRPVKPRVLAKQLRLPDDDRPLVRRAVKALVRRGLLAFGSGHLVHKATPPAVPPSPAPRETRPPRESSTTTPSPAAASRSATPKPKRASRAEKPTTSKPNARRTSAENFLVGTFRRTERGFGFVRPQSLPSGQPATREHDVYIPERESQDASTGDLVAVQLSTRRGGPRGPARGNGLQGMIVEIIERETHQFVGTYFESRGQALVQVDGTIFARPIAVGDPGAKNAQPDDKVVLEMVRFPSHVHDGEGVLTEVLGPRGEPGVDTLSILREFNLPGEFAADAQEEARQQAERFDERIGPGRRDLTAETVITIDPVDARDFDDAIGLERIDNGHWRLSVHIADVAHFVPTGSALDREAHARATSVYLPDRVIPMLPELISNGLASLQPERVRYTKTAILEFTPDGARVAVDLCSAAIRSARRFTYEEVDDYLAHPQAWKKKLTPAVHALVDRMHELAMILRTRRLRRGALELSLRDIQVDLDPQGRVTGAHRVENTVSHQIIEEFMLAANEAVAESLAQSGTPFLRRIHENPDPRKLRALSEFVTEVGFKTASLESRFELQVLLARAAGRPEEHAVNYALLRSLPRAVYSPREEGHYALASDCYCHFTSPIRRYPDLTVHRLIEARLRGKKPVTDLGKLVILGQHCSDREQRAEEAERELTRLKLLIYLSDRIGEELEGVITGVEEFGFFVEGLHLPAEGLVHITSLADDYYRFDRTTHTLTGHRAGHAFRLGDVVRVAVARVDLERRQLDFRLTDADHRGRLSAEAQRGANVRAVGKRPAGLRGAPPARRPAAGAPAREKPRGSGRGRKR